MKLNKESFPVNMNMVELKRKKTLVRPSQAELTKGKEVIIGEEQSLRMIKPKSLKDGASHSSAQRPPSTSSWPSTKKAGPASWGMKIGPSGIPNWIVRFP
jgi:hypothetical protein